VAREDRSRRGLALIGIRLHGRAEVIAWGLTKQIGPHEQPLYSRLWDRLRPVREQYAVVLLVPIKKGRDFRFDIKSMGDIATVDMCWPFCAVRPGCLDNLGTPDKEVL
jgi:hypothetical protein